MTKFNLSAEVLVSVYTSVEAETLEEAIEIAKDRDIERYVFDDKDQRNTEWVNDEYDGAPRNIKENK